MSELKKADEIVRALRQRVIAYERTYGEEDEVLEIAADLIESLTAQLADQTARANICEHDAKVWREDRDRLYEQLNGAKANGLIQKHIIKSGTSPIDADKIVRLTMDNVDLKRQLTASQRREKAAVEDLKYYLEINEENGVVFIPKFAVEKIINQSGPQAEEGEADGN